MSAETEQARKLVDGLVEGITSPEAVAQGLRNLPRAERPKPTLATDVVVDTDSPVAVLYGAYVSGKVSEEDYRAVFENL